MTNEELIEALNIYSVDLDAVPKTAVTETKFRTALREVKEKIDKYKWHDLRKNPEDLPVIHADWLLVIKENNPHFCTITDKLFIGDNLYDANDVDINSLEKGIGKYYGNVFLYANKVIAWREIEPFEEEEE